MRTEHPDYRRKFEAITAAQRARSRGAVVTAMRVLLAALLLTAPQPAMAEDGMFERWATPGVSAIVQLAPCGNTAMLCGTIRRLWDSVDDKGRTRLDAQNADASQRSRPLVGLTMLSDLKVAKAGVWEGRIYNPEDGQTYARR